MFKTLHYIYEVYKTQSFSKAAKNLFISQPSLSLTIIKFEKDMGITIFDRSTNPIKLTEAGQNFMTGIIRILEIEKELNNYIDDYNDLSVGELTIGAPSFFSGFLLPAFIAKFHKKFPYVKIKLVDRDFISLQNLIMSGEIDIIIDSEQFDDKLYEHHRLVAEHILIAIPSTDPINNSLKDYRMTREDILNNVHLNKDLPPIPFRALANSTFLMLEKGHDMYKRSEELFRKNDFEPKVLMSLNQLLTSYSMTNQQLGISLVSDTVIKYIDFGERILYYKIDDELSIRYIELAYKRNSYLSKSMQEFINMISSKQW